MGRKITLLRLSSLLLFFVAANVGAQELQNGSDAVMHSKLMTYEKSHQNSKLDNGIQEAMFGKTDLLLANKGKLLIRAYATTNNLKALQSDLEGIGAVECKHRGKYLTAWVPMGNLEQLERLSSLQSATAQMAGVSNFAIASGNVSVPTGVTVSQGDISMLTRSIRENLGIDGTGIRIGVLSNSFNNDGQASVGVANGDLPGANNPNGFTSDIVVLQEGPSFSNDEGRAMMELIHDVAPGAELFFASANLGLDNYPDAVRSLVDAGCDIIVDDINFFAEPYFQDGILNQVIDEITAEGVVYFTAGLNVGLNSYEADFVDSGVDIAGPWGRLHDFENGFTEDIIANGEAFTVSALTITLFPGVRPRLTMQWDDPSIFANANGPTPDTEMTILIIANRNGVRQPVAWSTNTSIQNGFAFEFLNNFSNNGNEPINVSIAIGFVDGPAPGRIKFINQNSNFGFSPASGTIVGHANAEGAITVGAVRYDNTPQFGNPLVQRSSSSVGGVEILLDRDGNSISPILRGKPDLMGPDGTNTSFFGGFDFDNDGFRNFNGTSAAAPHIAAAAALMFEAAQKNLPTDVVREAFTSTALDMATPGFDIRTGFGFVQADAAIASVLETPTVFRFELFNSTTQEVGPAIFNGAEIDLADIEGEDFNIRTLVDFGNGPSSRFPSRESTISKLTGERFRLHSDRSAPYFAFRNGSNRLVPGSYTLETTGRTSSRGRLSGPASVLYFSLINSDNLNADFLTLASTSISSDLTVFPNPTSGIVSVNRINLESPAKVTVFSMSNQIVFQQDFKANQVIENLDLSSNLPGVYFMRINDGVSEKTKTIIIR